MELKVMRIRHGEAEVPLPVRATEGSAGLDLQAAVEAPVTVAPGGMARIPTGIAVTLPEGTAGFVYARSGLAVKHGITLSNGVGVIDRDYTGEIVVGLCNISGEAYTIEPLERVAQLVVAPVCFPEIVEQPSLEKTARAQGGFGSTGR